MLIQEFAGGVVVLDRQSGTGQPVILGRLLNQRQCLLEAGAAKIANADLNGIGRERARGQPAQRHETDKQPDHVSSLSVSSTRQTIRLVPV